MVERVTGMSLGKYMQKNIWEPLGIKSMTFHLEERSDMRSRLMATSERIGGVHPMFGTPVCPIQLSKRRWSSSRGVKPYLTLVLKRSLEIILIP